MAKSQVRGGLGRGLDALIPAYTPQMTPQEGVFEIELDRIQPNAYQPREVFDQSKLSELIESIREHGVIQPVIVRSIDEELYELVVGERRLRACQSLGYQRIPAIVKEMTNLEMMEIALIENIQREDLNPVEEARAYQRLAREFGLTQEQIAQKVSKSRSSVANMMRLLNLPEEVLELLVREELTIGHVRPLLSLESAQAAEIAGRIKENGLSVREVEDLVRELTEFEKPASDEFNKKKKPEMKKELEPNLKELEGQLRLACGTKVEIIESVTGRGGKISIEFYGPDDLERIAGFFMKSSAQ